GQGNSSSARVLGDIAGNGDVGHGQTRGPAGRVAECDGDAATGAARRVAIHGRIAECDRGLAGAAVGETGVDQTRGQTAAIADAAQGRVAVNRVTAEAGSGRPGRTVGKVDVVDSDLNPDAAAGAVGEGIGIRAAGVVGNVAIGHGEGSRAAALCLDTGPD